MNWYDYQSEASQNVNLLNCKCEFVNSKPGIFDNIKQPSKLVQFLFFCFIFLFISVDAPIKQLDLLQKE